MTVAKRIGTTLLLIGIALLVVWGVRVAKIATSLQSDLAQAQAIADAKDISPQSACDLAKNLRSDVVELNQQAGILVSLTPVLGWLPSVGGDLRAAPDLFATADGLTESGAIVCASLAPMLDTMGKSGGFSLEQMTALLAANRANLERAALAADRAQSAWTRVDSQQLSPSIARRIQLLDRGLPLVRAAVTALAVAPDLLGAKSARTYLIIAQNEDELRPTGGYITGVGEVQLQDGQLLGMNFRDSYTVDDFSQPYPYPPEPLQRYMAIDQWVFRDSNWSPDFPTVVRQALPLYRPGHSIDPDGVIAIDQTALQEFVRVLGPLTVEGVEGQVTGDNVIAAARRAWAPPNGNFAGDWWVNRKSFMGPLAESIWERAKSGQFNLVAFGKAMLQVLDQKHVLIYMRDPRLSSLLAERGWDGALHQTSGDTLMVVDANLGYNKASVLVRESIDYTVDLSSPKPQATLTLTYTHTSQVNYPCKPEIRYDPIYEQAMDRCYFDYLRVYTPQGSQLIDATRFPISGDAFFSHQSEDGTVKSQPADEGAWTVFGVMGVLPTATTRTRVFSYFLPTNVIKWEQAIGSYALYVQKQSGTVGHPLTVRVKLPAQTTLIGDNQDQIEWNGAWLVYRTNLDRDQALILQFRRQSN